jgi:hypothetical protein
VLSELDGMSPEDERFDAKVTVLIENVRHHVQEEEEEYFPKVRDELGRNALNDLGDAMAAAKEVAPTHPHPRSPDTPPGNLVVGTAAGVVDRVGDTASGAAQGGLAALGDLIATVLRRKKPRTSARGSSTARSTASRVRAKAAEATQSVIDATTNGQRSAKATKRPAGKATKSATKTAKRASASAKRTSRTAASGTTPAKATARKAKTTARKAKATGRKAAARTSPASKRGASTAGRTARKAATSAKATAKRSARR